MDERDITNLLRSDAVDAKRGFRCPDDNQLAAYINKQLSTDRKRKLENHFADCKACLETLSFLTTEVGEPELVPARLLARARSLASHKPSPLWRWRWAMATATACLLIVVGFVIWRSRTPQKPIDFVAQTTPPTVDKPTIGPTIESVQPQVSPSTQKPRPSETHVPTVRGSGDELKPSVLFPREGSTVVLTKQPLRWKPVEGATFYEVKLLAEDGATVLTERTSNTELQVSKAVGSGKYFARVIAHLAGDRTVDSGLVGFKVE